MRKTTIEPSYYSVWRFTYAMVNVYWVSTILFLELTFCHVTKGQKNTTHVFPPNFEFGVGSAAYQIEGAWNISDKGASIWDELTHNRKYLIYDHSNGDVACDSYHLYKEDVKMLVDLGVDFYRFSISWPRILPNGLTNHISEDGVRYYNDLIDHLLANNVTPFVTMYHWDLPLKLQYLGGWTNSMIVDQFEDYARILFEKFGDRVKRWVTINEPMLICHEPYGHAYPLHAPAYSFPGVADYICGHNVLLAHARVWHLYDKMYRQKQKGEVGIVIYSPWFEPESDRPIDSELSERFLNFYFGWHGHPIFSKDGDYPLIMREVIANNSIKQGFKKSRLPELTKDQVDYVRGASDFLGLNFYTANMVNRTGGIPKPSPSKLEDEGYKRYQPKKWPSTVADWFSVYPPAIRKMLNWIKNSYNNPRVIITENGYPTFNGLTDVKRVDYMNKNLQQVLLAIQDGCNVIGYTHWALMDNFEWVDGYVVNFGLYEINFKDPKRTRTPRMSALVYKEIIRTKAVNESYSPNMPPSANSASKHYQITLFSLLCLVSSFALGSI